MLSAPNLCRVHMNLLHIRPPFEFFPKPTEGSHHSHDDHSPLSAQVQRYVLGPSDVGLSSRRRIIRILRQSPQVIPVHQKSRVTLGMGMFKHGSPERGLPRSGLSCDPDDGLFGTHGTKIQPWSLYLTMDCPLIPKFYSIFFDLCHLQSTTYGFSRKKNQLNRNPKGGAQVKGNGFGYSRSRKGTGDLVKRRGPRTRGPFLISGPFLFPTVSLVAGSMSNKHVNPNGAT